MSEYPKISHDHNPGDWGKTSWARIDFDDRNFAQFVRNEGAAPRFYSAGRYPEGYVEFNGLTNADIRAFAEEILRQFPDAPAPTYLIVVDGGGDEWVQVGNGIDAYIMVGTCRKEATEDANPRWSLASISKDYGVTRVVTATGEESLDD